MPPPSVEMASPMNCPSAFFWGQRKVQEETHCRLVGQETVTSPSLTSQVLQTLFPSQQYAFFTKTSQVTRHNRLRCLCRSALPHPSNSLPCLTNCPFPCFPVARLCTGPGAPVNWARYDSEKKVGIDFRAVFNTSMHSSKAAVRPTGVSIDVGPYRTDQPSGQPRRPPL